MITNYENKELQRHFINIKTTVDMHGVKANTPARIETDKDGTPLNKEWRRQVAESKNERLVKKYGKSIEIIAPVLNIEEPKKKTAVTKGD